MFKGTVNGENEWVRVVDRLRRLDDRVLGPRPSLGAFPQARTQGNVSTTVRRGVTILTCALATSFVPIALDTGRTLLAPLWMLAAVILIAAWVTLTDRAHPASAFALIGAAGCCIFALWLAGVVHLHPEQYAPTLAFAAVGGRMSWIAYRGTEPGE
jgi:predicted acyltransferase